MHVFISRDHNQVVYKYISIMTDLSVKTERFFKLITYIIIQNLNMGYLMNATWCNMIKVKSAKC
jgi:hypothetical protein